MSVAGLAGALLVGAALGLVLGLLGGGGGILAVPAFVHLLHMPVDQASTASLVVVAIGASAGLALHGFAGRVAWRIGAILGILGAAGAVLGARLALVADDRLQLAGLIALIFLAASGMLRNADDSSITRMRHRIPAAEAAVPVLAEGSRPAVMPSPARGAADPADGARPAADGLLPAPAPADSARPADGAPIPALIRDFPAPAHAPAPAPADGPRPSAAPAPAPADGLPTAGPQSTRWLSPRLLSSATGVGLVTGFFGVGGGFVAVPALMWGARLPVRTATATGLLVIVINSLIALAARGPESLPMPVTAQVAVAAAIAAAAGALWSRHVPARRLKQAFGWLLIVVGAHEVWQLALLY